MLRRIWVTVGDDKTRAAHRLADGQEVGADEPFRVDGEELFLPSDPSGSPENTFNCRCFVKYIVSEATESDDEESDPLRWEPVTTVEEGKKQLRNKFGVKTQSPQDLDPGFADPKSDDEVVETVNLVGAEIVRSHLIGAAHGATFSIQKPPPGTDGAGRRWTSKNNPRLFTVRLGMTEAEARAGAKKDKDGIPQQAAGYETTINVESRQSYVIRHEIGHTLLTDAVIAIFEKEKPDWYIRNVSNYAGKSVGEAAAEAFAWYTSDAYVPGSLPKHLEEVLEMMRQGRPPGIPR